MDDQYDRRRLPFTNGAVARRDLPDQMVHFSEKVDHATTTPGLVE